MKHIDLVLVGSVSKGPKSQPVYINNSQEFEDLFGSHHDKYPMYEQQSMGRSIRRKIKRVFSDIDPYGEENWEQ